MTAHSLASLRNFSFTSAEQFLHVLMATFSFSPVCTQDTHSECITFIRQWHVFIFIRCDFSGLNKESHLAFVNSIVYFSKKSFTQNPTHNDVISGDFIPFYNKNK